MAVEKISIFAELAKILGIRWPDIKEIICDKRLN